jgi:hypothetical protein
MKLVGYVVSTSLYTTKENAFKSYNKTSKAEWSKYESDSYTMVII